MKQSSHNLTLTVITLPLRALPHFLRAGIGKKSDPHDRTRILPPSARVSSQETILARARVVGSLYYPLQK